MTDTIVLKASSTLANGVGAHVTVIVDGKSIGTATIGSTLSSYTFNTTLASLATHDVQIVYDNDTVVNGQDRNLLLNSISINGATFSANSGYEVYHAQGQGNLAADGAMYWNGTAEFSLPASVIPAAPVTTTGTTTGTTGTDTVSFTASSTLAQGVGAHASLVVDGKTIGTVTVGTATATYSFKTTLTPNTAHDIKVVYNNDTVVNGQDRNLTLDSISVDGTTVAANSSYEVYHAQGQGDLAADGAMNWNGTAEFSLPASMFPAATPATTPPGFYVSVTGSDSGDGSAAHPFATLAKAVSAMAGSSTVHTTYVEGGTYTMSSTVALTAANSGDTITAASGSTPIFDGGGSLGTILQMNGASGVTLKGLTFQNTGSATAAVVLSGASNNSIIANHFLNTGEGLLLASGSSNNTVSGNELDNSATSAVEVKDGSNGNTLDSNLINGTGAIGTQGGGFFLHGVDNNAITDNLVENTAGIGIGIENWDSNTINVGNTIIGNMVENSNTSPLSTDSGAIYELGRSGVDTQSVISDNYISNPTQAAAAGSHIVGIYLDDLTSGVQVTNNIDADVVTHGVEIHGGSNITVSNNIFDLGSTGVSAVLFQAAPTDVSTTSAMTNDVVSKNIIASTSASPTAFSDIDGGTPTIDDNFYMDLLNSNFQTSGLSQTNALYGNAGFANEAAGNYALSATSGADAIGFTSIDQSVMGLHPKAAHWYASA